MMKRAFVLGLTLAALFAFQSSSFARGGRHHHCCAPVATCGGCGGCGASVGDCGGCGPVVAAPAPAPAVTYVDQTVTTYQSKIVTKQVPVQVPRMVTKTVPETYTYQVAVPVVAKKVRTETYYEQVMVPQPYTYTEMVQSIEKVTQNVTTCRTD